MGYFQDVSDATLPAVIGHRKLERRGIVVHETIGLDSLAYLQGGSLKDGRRVSSDYLIGRAGTVYQITPPGWYAFHSGISRWRGYQEADHTISQGFVGVECENDPNRHQKLTDLQYIALAWLIRRLCTAFPIDIRNVVGHDQVALPAGRKTDPITLDWAILTHELILPSIEAQRYVVTGELS